MQSDSPTQLTFASSTGINSRESGPDFRWMDVQRFTVREPTNVRLMLSAMLSDPMYDYSYAEPRRPGEALPRKDLHGPYRVDALSEDSFVEVGKEAAQARLRQWANTHGPLPTHLADEFARFIDAHLPGGHLILELPDMRATSSHDWGWVIGSDGFLEFVVIAPDLRSLTLFVASDD